ncbi:MAG: hypothetical protein PHS93_00910 [Candidatus Omnitrophica bacterium]|nr:hypothetical protein [Candidatus Omnitrophota bacterium]MDD5351713.1 hypothetical protein [Candidatus Omnitrophota bacterium]MDD5550923.1 hypothetical protein [Candidatus Omnitrophota bacterium]
MIKCVDCGKLTFEVEGSDMYKNKTEVLSGYCRNCNKEFTVVRIKSKVFKEGQKVKYEVYPVGTDIEGIITAEGIRATDPKILKELDKQGISHLCGYDEALNVRKTSD